MLKILVLLQVQPVSKDPVYSFKIFTSWIRVDMHTYIHAYIHTHIHK